MDQNGLNRGTGVRRKKVLIIDDSRVVRAWLHSILSADARLEIVGEACNAIEARDFLRVHSADVLTLDIEMPGMSGLEFLTRLMRARPMPVVMLSSLTSRGSDAAVRALSTGAIDCILKPTEGFTQHLSEDICERVYQAACTQPGQLPRLRKPLATSHQNETNYTKRYGQPCRRGSLILIGASTGGVSALETVLPDLDPQGPPVVIVQHMPGNFLESFAERLQRYLPHNVQLAKEHQTLCRGDIILAPGHNQHTKVKRTANGWTCVFTKPDGPTLHCPSVDELFLSAVSEAKNISAAILTGLGKDGAEGMLELSKAGAKTYGQDENTCVVYGMPRAAFCLGAVQRQLPIDCIGAALRQSNERPRNRASSAELSS